jgi:hypothetical protein
MLLTVMMFFQKFAPCRLIGRGIYRRVYTAPKIQNINILTAV